MRTPKSAVAALRAILGSFSGTAGSRSGVVVGGGGDDLGESHDDSEVTRRSKVVVVAEVWSVADDSKDFEYLPHPSLYIRGL